VRRAPSIDHKRSGILDHPLSRMMTAVLQNLDHLRALKKSRNSIAASLSPTAE
jgi:hypothetical protein